MNEHSSDSDVDERGDLRLERPRRQVRFVGRESELEALDRAVAESRGIFTIVGPPGVGKTRLAAELAEHIQESTPERDLQVWMVSCRDLHAPVEIARRVNELCGLGVPRLGEIDAAIRAVGEALNDRNRVLILDDLDHASEAARRILRTWYDDSGLCRFVATARRPLELEAETTFELSPLSEEASVELFRRSAEAAQFDTEIHDEEIVSELADRLDRLPLSLKLAAARTPVLDPEALLERLDRQLDVLNEPEPDSARWRDSLRNTIDRSWSQLAPAERSALAQISIFRGDVDLEAIEAVVDIDELAPEMTVSQVLQALVRKSLAYRTQSEEGDSFALYTAVRSFASEKLDEIEHSNPVARRHCNYYRSVAEAFQDALFSERLQPALREFGRQLPNLLAAVDWGLEEDPLAAAVITDALAAYNDWHPIPQVDSRLLQDVAEALPTDDRQERRYANRMRAWHEYDRYIEGERTTEELRSTFESIANRASECADPKIRVKAVVRIVWSLRHEDRYEEALDRIDRALEDISESDPPPLFQRLLAERASLVARIGTLREARETYRRALEAFDQTHDVLGETNLERHHWKIEAAHNQLEEAVDAAARARRLAEARNDDRELAFSHFIEGVNAICLGRLDEALERLETALELGSRFGKTRNLIQIRINRGVAHLAREDWAEAERDLERGREQSREYEYATARVTALGWGAALAYRRGDISRGDALLDTARDIADRPRPLLDLVAGERRLARAEEAVESNDVETARREWMAARSRAGRHLENGEDSADRSLPPTIEETVAARLLDRATEAFARERLDAHAPSGDWVRVDRRCTNWFQRPETEPVDISRRDPLRRILDALIDGRLNDPGRGLDKSELLATGWPGEELSPSEDAARLYQAISELRSMGLEDVIRREGHGYFLDPGVPLVAADHPAD